MSSNPYQHRTAFEALIPINHMGVRAYNPGDRVPADNVTLHGYEVGVQVAEITVDRNGTKIDPPLMEATSEPEPAAKPAVRKPAAKPADAPPT